MKVSLMTGIINWLPQGGSKILICLSHLFPQISQIVFLPHCPECPVCDPEGKKWMLGHQTRKLAKEPKMFPKRKVGKHSRYSVKKGLGTWARLEQVKQCFRRGIHLRHEAEAILCLARVAPTDKAPVRHLHKKGLSLSGSLLFHKLLRIFRHQESGFLKCQIEDAWDWIQGDGWSSVWVYSFTQKKKCMCVILAFGTPCIGRLYL